MTMDIRILSNSEIDSKFSVSVRVVEPNRLPSRFVVASDLPTSVKRVISLFNEGVDNSLYCSDAPCRFYTVGSCVKELVIKCGCSRYSVYSR